MLTKEDILPQQKASGLLTTGLALFSMFFGAGNLIFPLLIGEAVGEGAWFAILGLGLTAVLMPFLGLGAMVLYHADTRRFFGCVGRIPGILLCFLLQILLGPCGVIPRLITLMHATVQPYLSGLTLFPFSLILALIIFVCSFKRERLIHFLGTYFTPLLLLSLITLILSGLTTSKPPHASPNLLHHQSFIKGLVGGYHTMDLIAALLFATVVLPHFQTPSPGSSSPRSSVKKLVLSSLLAASLLMLTYIGLCLVSARHGGEWVGTLPPEQRLGAIATTLLGSLGGGVAAVAVLLACLTTAISLVAIFSDYLRKELCREKIGSSLALGITLAITTCFANFGFGGINALLTPVISIIYPGLILMTLFNLGRHFASMRRR